VAKVQRASPTLDTGELLIEPVAIAAWKVVDPTSIHQIQSSDLILPAITHTGAPHVLTSARDFADIWHARTLQGRSHCVLYVGRYYEVHQNLRALREIS
jgi:hypothetical protein